VSGAAGAGGSSGGLAGGTGGPMGVCLGTSWIRAKILIRLIDLADLVGLVDLCQGQGDLHQIWGPHVAQI